MEKQGLELLAAMLEAMGNKYPAEEAKGPTPPPPPELSEFFRQAALHNHVDPVTGEVLPSSSNHH
ncbi:MAG: hypothetical protein N2441_06365 [Rhodocyclaceae bacterium]|nr:hypothetical protein [Rhodocyclaceae bacterium]